MLYCSLCVYIGQEKEIEVLDKEVSQEEEEDGEDKEDVLDTEKREENESEEKKLETQESNEEEVTIFKPKMKEFPGSAEVKGLRIRREPSFLVS